MDRNVPPACHQHTRVLVLCVEEKGVKQEGKVRVTCQATHEGSAMSLMHTS